MMSEYGDRFRTILANRSEILRAIATSATTKAELTDALDTSRSTIDRAIRDLQTIECVEREDGDYVLTTAGKLALDEYDRYRDRTDAIHEEFEFLNLLPVDAAPDPALIVGADIRLPESHAPEQALKPTIDLFQRATSMRGLAPVVLSFYPDLLLDQVQQEDASIEVVAAPDVLAVLPDLPSDRIEAFLAHENVSLYRYADDIPYALWLMTTADGEYAGITAYEAGGVAGVLVNDSDAAVQWAEAQFESYRADAEPVTTDAIQ